MSEEQPPALQPREAINFFRGKGFAFGFDWRDVWQEEHARAFTVAKAMSRDLLEDIRDAVDAAIAGGETLREFREKLTPLLIARGWWGKSVERDPLTGEEKIVQLGSPRRLRTIFDMNLRSAYAAGRWERIQRQKKRFPFLIYVSVKDGRERPEHGAWHNTVLPVDDGWWQTHYPPCGWNCRCTARPANQRMLDRSGLKLTDPVRFPARDYVNKRTGEVTRIERGIDPGFSFNIGEAYLAGVSPRALPGAPGEEGDAAQAALGAGEIEKMMQILAPFGLDDAAQLLRGKVWRDAAGWPMALGAALFRDAAGRLRLPDGRRLAALQKQFRALSEPDAIRLVWVRDRAGRAMLMRRYVRQGAVLDIGRAGWRGATGATARLETGLLIWLRDAGAIAAYNPRQPRDANGRFASSRSAAAGFVEAAMAGTGMAASGHVLAPVSDGAAAQLERLGIVARPRSVALDRDLVRHIVKRHGKDSRGQKSITADDLANMASLFNRGRISRGTPPVSRNGSPRVHVRGKVGKNRYDAAFEVRKYRAVPISLRKR
ncbi:MAG: phage minor head protein [Blastomonas sp.]